MENTNLENTNSDLKRSILKEYNHRLNNDLQAVLAFIKLQKRFGIDDGEIIDFSCISIASISLIQNMMYDSDNNENFIGIREFFENFIKILNDNYTKSNIIFSNEIENDFEMNPKKVFHLMLLINEMINLSVAFSLKDENPKNIKFNLEKNGEECLLTYSDRGSGIGEALSGTDPRTVLFMQSLKQIDGILEPSNDNSIISIKFAYD